MARKEDAYGGSVPDENEWRYDTWKWKPLIDIIAIAYVIIVPLCLIWAGWAAKTNNNVDIIETRHLVAFKSHDTREMEWSYFLLLGGGGSEKDEYYYYYLYTTDDGGYRRGTLDVASNIVIYEIEGEVSRIEYLSNGMGIHYKVYIPPGSILFEYNVQLP